MMLRPAIPTTMGISGEVVRNAEAAVAIAAKATHCHFTFRIAIGEYTNN